MSSIVKNYFGVLEVISSFIMIRRKYAKFFKGFKTRILAKIAALTLVQFINKFIFDRPINNIKSQIT